MNLPKIDQCRSKTSISLLEQRYIQNNPSPKNYQNMISFDKSDSISDDKNLKSHALIQECLQEIQKIDS